MKWTVQNISFGLCILLAYLFIGYTSDNSGTIENSRWVNEYLPYAVMSCVPVGFFVINYRHARLVPYSLLVTAIHTSIWFLVLIAVLSNVHSVIDGR